MKRFPGLWLLLWALLTPTARAAELPDSLFLTRAERTQTAPAAAALPARTSLDALVYYSPEQWQVWVNGQAYQPGSAPADFTIIAVTPEQVTLEAQRDGAPVRFTLAPHQSYDWGTQSVREGAP